MLIFNVSNNMVPVDEVLKSKIRLGSKKIRMINSTNLVAKMALEVTTDDAIVVVLRHLVAIVLVTQVHVEMHRTLVQVQIALRGEGRGWAERALERALPHIPVGVCHLTRVLVLPHLMSVAV